MQRQLIWFRQDLRIQDHAALWHVTQSGHTTALIIFSPEQWRIHHDAPIKIDLYLRQIEQLKHSLESLNIPLIIKIIPLWKDLTQEILKLCYDLNIENVHANVECGINELNRDFQIQKALNQHHKDLILHHDRSIFPIGSIRNKSNQPYQVFGAFKKYCYEQFSISIPHCYPEPEIQQPIALEKLDHLEIANHSNIPTLSDLGFDDVDHPHTHYPVGEKYAHELLDQFIADQVQHYQAERDFPNIQGTSQLSAYLNIGILSIRQCLNALFRDQQGYFHIDNIGQQTWLDELLWREFYQHILFDFPRVSKHLPFKEMTQKLQWRDAPEDLKAWQMGLTGIPIVDAGMRQLLHTGWMHNRVRMIVAMFLTKNLLIDWRSGEQWFMQHLIDGDLAANNGGWQWCASTGTDSVPYFRIFNPISQSQRFDAQGDYIRQWVPELAHLDAKSIHEPYAKHLNIELNYPKPIVDLKQSRIRAIEAFKQL
ncbi:deoxyribodipyrimidine photo-lyase [Acinetobacter wuhouensis]|uniref:cryptochrome/photolyase family protein n=1 Tax=Acinetobacter wuhouensis TaxID=1879050 RepID=UPI00083AE67D|nr:deoxyribodipyrimidine photo-lyase [Acinetobacter wuhouensis]AXQ22977.1 deoxyribodipyrimidine photo-lyase [Acinetobacter wuhouensis]